MHTPASYLIGLGLHRLTAQMDPSTRSVWEPDGAIHLIRDGTIHDERDYLLHRWSPSPVLTLWSDDHAGLDHDQADLLIIERSHAPRLQLYRDTIAAARRVLAARDDKAGLITRWRSAAPETALDWIDACLTVSGGEIRYNWLLGSGGNDGRLSFGRVYRRAVAMVVDVETGEPTRDGQRWLDGLMGLIDGPEPRLSGLVGGQFFSGAADVNPWAWLILLEGCMVMGSGLWVYDDRITQWPGTFAVTPAGYASAAESDREDGTEHWWPVWRRPMSIGEVRGLMIEPVLRRGHQPIDGLDMMRAMVGMEHRDHRYLRVLQRRRNGLSRLLTIEDLV